jgi:hypothetical protein
LWLPDVQPDNECRIAHRQHEAEHANGTVLHEHAT